VHVTCGRCSVLLWRRSDTLCTSGFIDDVIFARKPRLLDVVPNWAQCMRSLGLGYKWCAAIPVTGQRTHGPTFWALEVTAWWQHQGRRLRSMTGLFVCAAARPPVSGVERWSVVSARLTEDVCRPVLAMMTVFASHQWLESVDTARLESVDWTAAAAAVSLSLTDWDRCCTSVYFLNYPQCNGRWRSSGLAEFVNSGNSTVTMPNCIYWTKNIPMSRLSREHYQTWWPNNTHLLLTDYWSFTVHL